MNGSYADPNGSVYSWSDLVKMGLVEVSADLRLLKVAPHLDGSLWLDRKIIGIGKMAFKESKLHAILLNDDLQFIGDFAFFNCTNIQSLEIPAYVSKIGKGITTGCVNLNKITSDMRKHYFVHNNCILNSKAEVIAGCQYSSLRGVKAIKTLAFVGFNFAELAIYNCETIETNAFAKCKFNKVMILSGNTPTNVLNDAFTQCKIDSMGVDSRIPTLTLPKDTKIVTLVVPKSDDFNGSLNDLR